MSLSDRLAKYFTRNSRSRGEHYYRTGRVNVVDGSDSELFAHVRGSAVYDVSLTFQNGTLTTWCGCPFYGNYGTLCKHLWAAVLTAEDVDFLSAVVSAKEPLVVSDDAAFDGSQDEETPGPEIAAPPRPAVPAPPRKWVATQQTSWRSKFSALAAPRVGLPPEWPANREILYIIDVPRSRGRDGLSLVLQTHERQPDGTSKQHLPIAIERRQIRVLPGADDREILTVLGGSDIYTYNYYSRLPDSFLLPPTLSALLIPRIVRTGRCSLALHKSGETVAAIFDEGEPWGFELELRSRRDGGCSLHGLFRRGEEQMDLADAALITTGFLLRSNRIARLDEGASMEWMLGLRKSGPMIGKPDELDEFLTALLGSPNLPPLKVPDELRFKEVRARPAPRIRIFKGRTFNRQERLRAEVSFAYEDRVIAEFDPAGGIYDSSNRRFLRRDLDAERAAGELLKELGVKLEPPHYTQPETTWEMTAARLPEVVRSLVEAGWQVEAENRMFRRADTSRIDVSSGVDWFELRGAIEYGQNTAALPELLAALRRGEKMVLLDDGSYGMLPEEWLRRVAPLAAMGTAENGHIRFGRSQAGLLDALLASQPEARCDQTFETIRKELRSFQGIEASPQPAGFVGHLRDYQGEGLGWMHFLRRFSFGGCLADDMGVGKTAQVLALLETRREARAADNPVSPSLVVVPRSLVFNWKEEAARFTPRLRVLDWSDRERREEALADYDLVLITYGTLRRDIVRLKDLEFDYVVLDESQAIKNANTLTAKAVRLLRGNHRLALSGTPIENHLGELWSLFEFLNPGILGAASAFNGTGGAMRNPDDDTRRVLRQALRPFILRRTKEQVARELPSKTEQTMHCEMEPAERKRYEDLRQHYRQSLLKRIETEGIAKSKIQVLEALLRLRQAACHPALIDPERIGESSAKLEVLMERLREVVEEGHKALVFSQFTSFLRVVRDRLDRSGISYEYLDGRTRDRQARVERFQNDEDCPTFLVSLKAGGLGLNLTAAEYVFILDPWWNPAIEAQAVDRAHRIGQSRPVFAYRLITRGTVEEKVLELQEGKRDLADAIISADNSIIRSLRAEDLSLLLS